MTEQTIRAEAPEPWPVEIDLVLSALDAGNAFDPDRRAMARMLYRVRAELRLFSDAPEKGPWVLYTRDADPRGLGFITRHRLPLGYGGWIELRTPSGHKLRAHCTLFRCRQMASGWYEGSLSFNAQQKAFEATGT